MLKNGLQALCLLDAHVDDETMDRILGWLLNSETVNTLEELDLRQNALTEIPWQLSRFKKLRSVILSKNPMSGIIYANISSVFSSILDIWLDDTGIQTIQPGAFKGLAYCFIVSHKGIIKNI